MLCFYPLPLRYGLRIVTSFKLFFRPLFFFYRIQTHTTHSRNETRLNVFCKKKKGFEM
jgi:hypothetical protein